MERSEFLLLMEKYAERIENIRQSAHELHRSVNQLYGSNHPYGYHLDMVVDGVRDFGHLVCACEDDVIPMFFGGKGRTRAERAGEKYYKGIRETPYAPFVKMCDRLANISYSCSQDDSDNGRMKKIYKEEVPHFLNSIDPHSTDCRFKVPKEMVLRLAECLIDDMEHDELNGFISDYYDQ